ncbi:hypothetical protein [Marinomonas ostreistagni]|uniref:Intracellular septation protein A n=1 Tax=Marinomonas ostreistagni TaxID=359209 RepID=A0ABS0Z8D7_9GAMM|nr:hypothetical protein [Marinomonas ostreistagni]MBJ7549926.1 hypothetical protein [Marinomonas ostreistagni]
MFVLRGIVYLLVLAGIAQCISLEAFEFGVNAQYSEDSLTEFLQMIFAIGSALLFALSARYSRELRQACILLSALMLAMFVRESDSFLDQFVFDGAWQVLVFGVLLGTVILLRRQLKESYRSLKVFSQTSSFGFVTAGLVIIIGFSRLFGRSSFWQSVMGDGYVRNVKNIVEEGTELLGYTIVVIAAAELLCFVFSVARKRQHNIQASQKLRSYSKVELAH